MTSRPSPSVVHPSLAHPSAELDGAAPSRTDETVGRAAGVIGGPRGRYAAAPSRWFSPLRVILALTMFTLLLGYAQKAPCADGQWVGNSQYSQVCYSDVIPLWSAERLNVGAVPYRDHAVEYPVLTGVFMWGTAEVTRALGPPLGTVDLGLLFAVLTCIGLALFGLATAGFTAAAARPRPWDAAIFAAGPLLVFHAFSNWDLIAMAFTAAALWAWSRRHPVAAGILLGLGTAAKLYPIFVLGALLVLAVRTKRYREPVICAVATVLAWLAVNLPVAGAFYPGWREFYAFSADRPAEASTVWAMIHYVTTVGLGGGNGSSWVPPGLNVAVLLIVALAVVAGLGLAAPVRPRVGQLAFLCVVAFLLTTKVWSPQYSIWLIPLLALARPRWRLALLWQFSEILVWIVTLLWLSGFSRPDRSLDYGWLMFVLLIRDAILLVLCALIVRDMWRPEHDVVRAGGLDDPTGGVFADGHPEDSPPRLRFVDHRSEVDTSTELVDVTGEHRPRPGGAPPDEPPPV